MIPENLTKENYIIQAAKHYNTPRCVMAEFKEDINRVITVKKLIGKYLSRNELNERLILNQIIIIANVFGVEFCVRVLFLLLKEEQYSCLKTFLLYLGYIGERVENVEGKVIFNHDLPVDMTVANVLRKL